jgi:type II secretory pathway component PulC
MKINNFTIALPTNWKQQGALIASASLASLMLLTLIVGLWQWHDDWQLVHQKMPVASSTIQDDAIANMIKTLPKAHLFGENLVDGNMPITSLQLRVTGIVKSTTDNSREVSKAYISMSGQPAKIYQVGDSLPYGVKVYEITDNAVILENDSHLEKLPLPREPLVFKARDKEENT